MEYISKKSKEYYIPVSVTHRLMEISRLRNEEPKPGEKLQTDKEIKNVLQSARVLLSREERIISCMATGLV